MRQLYERGDKVKIVSVDERLKKLGFKSGSIHKVWIDYEDLIYLETPIKHTTSEDYFYPNQLKAV